jgi:hypothetical protein
MRHLTRARLCCVALLTVALLVTLLRPTREPPPRNVWAWESYQALQLGMSEEEAEAIFGSPAGEHNCEPFRAHWCQSGDPEEMDRSAPATRHEEWVYDDGRVIVGFDAGGQVRSKRFSSNWYVPETPLDILRGWLEALF